MNEIGEIFGQVVFWHWWVLAVALIAIEVFAPSTVLLWPGIAAGVVGLTMLVAGDAMLWQYQVLLFAVLSVVSLVAWRLYARKHVKPGDETTLNRRGEQYVGRVLTLEEPIVNGQGRAVVDDSHWRVSGEDMPAGTRVRVVGVDATVLKVEAA
jgi:membrane protein implicated in regulation of membrane protease activity